MGSKCYSRTVQILSSLNPIDMKDIFKNWHFISKRIKGCKHLLLLSDFDGTLCKIVNRPSEIKLSKLVKTSLEAIEKLTNVSLGIISGRPLRDIKKIIGLKKTFYVGNHGFEIEYFNKKRKNFIHPQAKKTLNLLRKIKKELKKEIDNIDGASLEDKVYTLSIHYRLVKPKDITKVKRIFNGLIKKYKSQGKVRVTSGKKVYEIRPPIDWNKGKAILKIKKILNKPHLRTIYLGDDATDEDAFRVLNKDDLAIFVGLKRHSRANWRIKNTTEVANFLKRIYKLRFSI